MAKCYFELRKQSARGTDSIAADIMRHLHTRQYLGKVVVVCPQPGALLAASRKQWLKLTRVIQKQRSSTLNADKILKYTHTITHMQYMRFSTKLPEDDPEADVYFLHERQCATTPIHCYSIYVTAEVSEDNARELISQLPAEALVIDYYSNTHWGRFGLQSKMVLEQQVASEWLQVQRFLQSNNIHIQEFYVGSHYNMEALDDALDTLLGISHRFLRIANEFQRALELARPIRINRNIRQEYDTLVLLAYRVQALSPGAFTQHFLESYNEDDTFFFYDRKRLAHTYDRQAINALLTVHISHGRNTLAAALAAYYAHQDRPRTKSLQKTARQLLRSDYL